MNKKVAIIMGSDSDLPIMKDSAKFLDNMGISYEMKILSVHRCPDEAIDYAKSVTSVCEKEYTLTNEESGGIGMICGGWNRILFVPLA